MRLGKLPGAILLIGLIASLTANAETFYEMSGKVTADLRYFTQKAQFTHQDYDTNLAFSVESEFYWEWNDGSDSITFTPFLRVDEHDNERTHSDIRELAWIHVGNDWEVRTGLSKVFWGVTEFQHLVDVINQTDAVEDFDGEDKLGQPMINFSIVRDWGIVDVFLLPGFRERTFPGREGRLRSGLIVDTDQAFYESGAGEKHLDAALRWSHTLGDFDLGLYWFHGTNREPILQPQTISGTTVLIPYYEQIDQIGLDVQATIDSWLWKLETIHRHSNNQEFWAIQAGFEYTLYALKDTASDLGLLLEYGWDKRGKNTEAAIQNDLFMGVRWVLNDVQSTEILAGFGHDFDYHSQSVIFEARRRIGDNWNISLDGRFFSANNNADLVYNLKQDDHFQLTLERYF